MDPVPRIIPNRTVTVIDLKGPVIYKNIPGFATEFLHSLVHTAITSDGRLVCASAWHS